jgi:outer membrane immunogenic protein
MKLFRAISLTLVALCALGSAATAADLGGGRRGHISEGPILVDKPFSWTGLYVGASVGYGWSDIDWTETGPDFNGSHSGEGWLAGGQIGYNLQAGRFVYGIEGDFTKAWIDGGNGCCDHSVNWLASVRGRAGITGFDNRTLFYATAGAAWADVDYASINGSTSNTHFGWVAGGGIERALTPNLSARVEYLYYNFDDSTAAPGTVAPGAATFDPTIHTVRFGVNYKF